MSRPFWHLRRRSAQVRDEMDEEIRFHLEMRAAELERRGWSPAAARQEALRRFGGVEETRDYCVSADMKKERTTRRRLHLGEAAQDVAHGVRQLRRRPGFAITAVLTLAVGIGATTAIFSAADHILLRPLPYRDSDRVATLWETDLSAGGARKEVSPGNFMDWRSRTTTFSDMALAVPWGADLTGVGPPEAVQGFRVTEGFFEALGVSALVGRTFTAEEYRTDDGQAVLISYSLWNRRFGGDPAVVGRRITLDGAPTTVVGILPPTLEYPESLDLWRPLPDRPEFAEDRDSRYMFVVGRLEPGVTMEQAEADLGRVAAGLAAEYPATNSRTGAALVPLQEQVLGRARPALLVLLGAVAMVLLIACANVTALLLARGAERQRELAVRAAIGAGRGRLVRQLLVESAVLGVLGGAAGVLLAYWGVRALAALAPEGLPRAQNIAIDGRVLAFAVAATVLSALLFGVAPALRFSRPELGDALRSAGRGQVGGVRGGVRGVLVAAEVALALVLLIGAGLLGRSFLALLANDLGFRTEQRVSLQTFLWDRNPTTERRIARVGEIITRLQDRPGVEEAAAVSSLPFHPHAITAASPMVPEGQAPSRPGEGEEVFTTIATPNYFRVVGIPLRRGRSFTDADRAESPPVAVVNESLARRYFPGQDPVGRRVTIGVMSVPVLREIVGVVADVRPDAPDAEPRPELFVPHAQHGSGSMTFVARTAGRPGPMVNELQKVVWEVDPEQTVYHAATLDALVADTLAERRFQLALLGTFSIVALALAVVGLYGLVSFSTARRTGEIGIRMALGAGAGQIVRMVVGEGVRVALPGVVAGVVGALVLTRFLRGMLYRVEAVDPATYAQLALLMIAVAAVAAFVPARRAAAVDPMHALRGE